MQPSTILSVKTVSKSYGNVIALDKVSLAFRTGEIHAVLGENGAGKSTLMGVLAGFVIPDSGSVQLRDAELEFGRPHETKDAGIEMVHQHFMLVQELSVLENLALTRMGDLWGLYDLISVVEEVGLIAKRLDWEIDFEARVSELPIGTQQRVEILKALGGNAEILIFDEPTAVLSPEETEDFFIVLRTLRGEGKCVILIAHKLSEVLSVADRVSVLRQGKFVASAQKSEVDETVLANWMVGELPEPSVPLSDVDQKPLMVATGLHALGSQGGVAVRDVSFTVSRGEILGIGGVDGNGQPELAEVLAGLRPLDRGEITWAEQGCKIGFVPQDRQGQGLALGMSITDNFLIAGFKRGELFSGPLLSPKLVQKYAERLISEYEIKIDDVSDVAGSLSGGNQQKVVVSRVLNEKPDFLVVHNPTRGLDIRATAYVRARLLDAAREGAAVVLISTDHDELSELASRILYMSKGQLFAGGSEAAVGGGQ